jgi:hypothetical protein
MRRLIAIILLTVIISASAGAGTVGYILDNRWSAYVEQLNIEYEEQQQETRRFSDARGYWRGMYSMCFMLLYGDTFTCLRGARSGYLAGNHLEPPSPGWDWFYVRYQGQVQ